MWVLDKQSQFTIVLLHVWPCGEFLQQLSRFLPLLALPWWFLPALGDALPAGQSSASLHTEDPTPIPSPCRCSVFCSVLSSRCLVSISPTSGPGCFAFLESPFFAGFRHWTPARIPLSGTELNFWLSLFLGLGPWHPLGSSCSGCAVGLFFSWCIDILVFVHEPTGARMGASSCRQGSIKGSRDSSRLMDDHVDCAPRLSGIWRGPRLLQGIQRNTFWGPCRDAPSCPSVSVLREDLSTVFPSDTSFLVPTQFPDGSLVPQVMLSSSTANVVPGQPPREDARC